MVGVVLCGGQSSRMGTDKGLMKNQAQSWAQTAFDKLSALDIPVKLSVNKNQLPDYAELFHPTDLITDNESFQLKGPLLGVLSTHLLYPGKDIFVLACDMLLMETNILKQLMNAYQANAEAGAFVFTNNGEPEPLCGIYRSANLDHIVQMYQSQQLAKHSMKFMLDHINTYTIPLADDQKKFFRNFNAHAELNGL